MQTNNLLYNDSVISAFGAAFIATTLTHPLDVLRIKLTCDFSSKYDVKLYTSMFDCLKKTLKS